uniref:Signal recognition particle subunit SRP68 n=1 Tax=Cacopsylla melanoneura TaxID=428564 RepID=A0A8D8V9S8_9HEMI
MTRSNVFAPFSPVKSLFLKPKVGSCQKKSSENPWKMTVAEGNPVENEETPVKAQPKEAAKPKPLYTIEILKIIKDAQQQHGLRHGDYQRYRGYCTRRIGRLRKTLHLPQGDKRHFKKREVTDQHLKDEKYIYIPLFLAERAWGNAMQLRQEANTEPRKKFHLISRLRKAAGYAVQLQTLCEAEVCDARTKLEAQAYVSWIVGVLEFELKLWKSAMKNLKEAQVVYEKLVAALNEDDAVLYKQKVEELTPSLRYCAYNIGDQTGIEDLMQLRSQAHGELLHSLDSLMIQSKERSTEVLSEVSWRSRSVAVRSERVRVFLLAERALDSSLTGSTGDRIELLESHLMDCKDAIQTVKEEVKLDPNSKNRTPGQGLSSLQYLHSYLMNIRLERTIQRNLLLALQAKDNLNKAESAQQQGGEGRKSKPQDLVRLYEIILQNLAELQQLAGVEEDAGFQENVEVRLKTYKAFRCFYIAQSLAALRRWRDCVALYSRASQYSQDALQSLPKSGDLATLRSELTTLEGEIDANKYSALAYSVLGTEETSADLATVGGKTGTGKLKKVPLAERLGEYYEDPSLSTRSPNIIRLPPDMQPIPCKPLFFDLAQNQLEYPPLEDKLDAKNKASVAAGQQGAAGISGFVKGLWGWGGSKQ